MYELKTHLSDDLKFPEEISSRISGIGRANHSLVESFCFSHEERSTDITFGVVAVKKNSDRTCDIRICYFTIEAKYNPT